MKRLQGAFAGPGRLVWIGLRPARREPLVPVPEAYVVPGQGLVGDHARAGRREVSIVQLEHLAVIAALVGRAQVEPGDLRRNLAISGISVQALTGRRFRIGGALFVGTGPCHPCSRMEEALGLGGYNAVRGHGGIVAQVLSAGRVAIGDALSAVT